ncbi:hypothetical protein BK647_10905 [Pseudomonas protegens]|uniref:hypothetical protein n=1 Tax=Pseudomonas TaxID=286 RepID=UPI0008070200|nr:hypothetical protein [Pseudomonas protegens]OBZ23369.1 hypothetical protein BBH58_21765 [Pseudomonas protegens]OBZ30260.1 hypothetical protein BBH57_10320 [Pseudomonas protegens]ROM44982.1 hypothetical protein BK647_10905 [Pseudomonas protegens]
MKRNHWLLYSVLTLGLLQVSAAQAWQLRGGGGGARTFVVPHGGGGGGPAPRPMPQPRPMPHPMPQPPQPAPHPEPHPYPQPHPGPGPGPGPHPYPGPGPEPHPYPGPGPQPYPGPPGPPPPPPDHGDDWYHPWGAAAVIGATTAAAFAIGTQVDSVPPDCVSVVASGVAYQHCGNTWYQPQYIGGSLRYVVVAAPW